MSSQFFSVDNTPIVIQLNPEMLRNRAPRQDNRRPYNNVDLKGFLRIQPKSLGIIQIMTGVMIFLFGIVLTVTTMRIFPLTVYSGITFWGSFIYISAGSLSVAAENKLYPCVVKASLGMNVISAVTAGIAISLMSINVYVLSNVPCGYYSQYSREEICLHYESTELGIIGILLLLSIIQMIISICISAFACKSTCDTDFSLVNLSLNQVTEGEITSLNIPQ